MSLKRDELSALATHLAETRPQLEIIESLDEELHAGVSK